MLETIITGICGAGWLATLIMFFIQRNDTAKQKKNDDSKRLYDVEEALKKNEKDNVRIQLLLLMSTYTEEDEHELLTCAEHYFVELKSNWYMTAKFNRFLQKNNIAVPEWFKE